MLWLYLTWYIDFFVVCSLMLWSWQWTLWILHIDIIQRNQVLQKLDLKICKHITCHSSSCRPSDETFHCEFKCFDSFISTVNLLVFKLFARIQSQKQNLDYIGKPYEIFVIAHHRIQNTSITRMSPDALGFLRTAPISFRYIALFVAAHHSMCWYSFGIFYHVS